MNYGYIYNIGSQNVSAGNDIIFSSNHALKGISHSPGTNNIRVKKKGVYFIIFSALDTAENFGITVNGVIQAPLSQYGQFTPVVTSTRSVIGFLILELSKNTLITVRNVGTETVSLPNKADPSEPVTSPVVVNASILFKQIS